MTARSASSTSHGPATVTTVSTLTTRQLANRRLGWSPALVALALFVITLWLRA